MEHRPAPIGLDELPNLDAYAVGQSNQDLLHLASREYVLDGMPVRWGREPDDHTGGSMDGQQVWWALEYAGQTLRLGTSESLAQAWMAPWGLRLVDLNPQTLDLLAVSHLMPQLPPSLRFQAAAFSLDGLGPPSEELTVHGCWRARHAQTGERLAHRVQVLAPPAFALYALLATLDTVLKPQRLKPKLAGFKVQWPVVAARWSVEAGELADLELGDVLLLS